MAKRFIVSDYINEDNQIRNDNTNKNKIFSPSIDENQPTIQNKIFDPTSYGRLEKQTFNSNEYNKPSITPNNDDFWAKIRNDGDYIKNTIGNTKVGKFLSDNPVTNFLESLSIKTDNALMPGSAQEQAKDLGKVGNKVTDIAGDLLSYAAPIPGLQGENLVSVANKAVKPLENTLLNKVGSSKLGQYGVNALKSGLEFGGINALRSNTQGDSLGETVKQLGEGFAGGAVLGTVGKGLGEIIPKAFPKWKTTYESNMPEDVLSNTESQTKPSFDMSGKYKIKNTQLENAQNKLNGAMEEVQNYFQHYKLTPEEINRIKPELGIDLDKLVQDVAKYENGFKLNEVTDKTFSPYVAGVKEAPTKLQKPNVLDSKNIDFQLNSLKPGNDVIFNNKTFTLGEKGIDGQYDLLDSSGKPVISTTPENIKVLPDTMNKPTLEIPKDEAAVTKTTGISKDIENMKIRELRAEKNRLIRDYTDYVNEGKTDVAERLNTRISEIDDILGEKSPLPDNVYSKDKAVLSLNRETFDRNLDSVFGEDSSTFKGLYSEPIKSAEAESVRLKNKLRDEVRALDIKPQSKESELVQKLGEGQITLEDLKNNKDIDWKKISNATEHFKKTYDSLLDSANEVLARNGYKPIAKRANYFPHFEEINPILKALGIDNPELPTDINGLTADFAPGKSFFTNALHRKGEKTVFDAVRGFDNYVEGISKVIYHTDNIQRIRSLERDIRTIYTDKTELTNFVSYLHDYGNMLAGKKSAMDRGTEGTIGRGVYKFLDFVRKQTGANMVGGNISSALTNFIPLTQSIATTNKVDFAKGMFEAFKNSLPGLDDGFAKKSDYLTRRFGSDKLFLGKFEKVSDVANGMFKLVDKFVSETIVRSKYLENMKKGMPNSIALSEADKWAAKIMADRSVGQSPLLFNSKVWGTLFQFQLEVNNQISFLFKDLPKEKLKDGVNAKSIAALTGTASQVAIFSYLFNNLYEKAIGRRPAFDVLGVIEKANKDFNNENLDKGTAKENLLNNVKDQLPFVSTLTGGRLPISGVVPNLETMFTGKADNKKELSKLPYLFLPTGAGQILKTSKGLTALNDGGVYNKDKSQLLYPVEPSTENKVKAALLGPSSFKETRDYYDNGRNPLGETQTEEFKKLVSKGNKPQDVYEKFIDERSVNKEKDSLYQFAKEFNFNKTEKSSLEKVANNVTKNKQMTAEDKIKALRNIKEKLSAQGGNSK